MKKQQKFIVRCNNAGVFFGEIKSKTDTTITMTNVQKIYYWEGACAVEELALEGTTLPNNCKLTIVVPEMELKDWIQILPCSDKSINILNNINIWKKS